MISSPSTRGAGDHGCRPLLWPTETATERALPHRRLVEAIAARDEVGARHHASEIVKLTETGTERGR
ncbi:hypothetical protein BAY59_11465 [Prauserella coralliicola]|nr:hypothetical protein BAY59_11465 [Prauserella coralliicola]